MTYRNTHIYADLAERVEELRTYRNKQIEPGHGGEVSFAAIVNAALKSYLDAHPVPKAPEGFQRVKK